MNIQKHTKMDDPEGLISIFRHHHNPPKTLYTSGNLSALNGQKKITIVGSRMHHPDAERIIEKLLKGLASYPIVIVSGLALGVDTLAHRYALQYHIPTVAFPGSGLEKIYPAINSALAAEIIDNGGTLISEFSPETQAARWTFPMRNRLMAQYADLVLIIEAQDSSGTLITARHALEAGVSLGVIPYSPLVTSARGSNKLLQDGAYPILDYTDILRLLNIEIKQKEQNTNKHLTADEQAILRVLDAPMHKQEVFELCNLDFTCFTQTLSKLEINGHISERMGVVTKL